tara:strand:+ start:8813 stop:11026 length:2214 start_codon:yes stop_codon:yes gene_type:complete
MDKDLSTTPVTYRRKDSTCDFSRLSSGIASLNGENVHDIAFGLGIAHARDRSLQMEMARLAGQGRLSECLKCNEETENIDIFMREMGMSYEAKKEVSQISTLANDYLQAYADGVNYVWENEKTPWEFKLVRHKLQPWKPEHSLLTIKLMSYIGLAQTQEDIERLIIQSVREGMDITKLKSLFAPNLSDLSSKRIEYLRNVKYLRAKLPIEIKTLSYLPKLIASNNWVIAPSKSKSKKPILCCDPHLEVNRLPAVWYEMHAKTQDNVYAGATMPGVPGLIMGRTKEISYSFTYGFMDMVDFFIEDIRDGKAVHEDGIKELNTRTETIKRKGKPDLHHKVFETQSGVLEVPVANKIEDGLYLSRAWTNQKGGTGDTIEAILGIQLSSTVEEFRKHAARVSISCNWLAADSLGQIIYQQSGRAPIRAASGLVPLEAWIKSNLWQGMVDPRDLETIRNPPEGYLCTANNMIENSGPYQVLNLPMGPYRHDRIRDVLSGLPQIDIEQMKTLQNDLYSLQAESFLEIFEGDFPQTPLGKSLSQWDRCYNLESVEAALFEKFYRTLLIEVFGDNFFGKDSFEFLHNETSTITDYYYLFDQILLSDNDEVLELWFGGAKKRKELFHICLSRTLSQSNSYQLLPWGETNTISMDHLFFQGKLPKFLGFDQPKLGLPGGRATVVQGAVYKAHGRASSFAPSWRMIADMNDNKIHTVLAGGVSDRRFDSSYKSEISNWLAGRYKIIQL